MGLGRIVLCLLCTFTAAARTSNMSTAALIDAFNSEFTYDVRVQKFNLMTRSSFAFFRGSNHLFMMDTIASPQRSKFGKAKAFLQGDAHIYNMGTYDIARGLIRINGTGEEQGDIVYGLNDFDEAFIGDIQLDVWRVAVSLILTLRENLGAPNTTLERSITASFARTYADSIVALAEGLAEKPPLTQDIENAQGKMSTFFKFLQENDRRAKMFDLYVLKKKDNFDTTKGKLSPPNTLDADAIRRQMSQVNIHMAPELCNNHLDCASFLAVKSIAARVDTGIGSYGVKRFWALIEGPSTKAKDDYILDIKEQPWPTAYGFLTGDERAEFEARYFNVSNASRVIEAERAMTNGISKIGGTIVIEGSSYSVRDRSPWKSTFPALADEPTDDDFPDQGEGWAFGGVNETGSDMNMILSTWAHVLAVAHFLGAQNLNLPFAADFDNMIKATPGGLDDFAEATSSYAVEYAAQVESDYSDFRAWGNCIGNICVWPPIPESNHEPAKGPNYLVAVLVVIAVVTVLGLLCLWIYGSRKRHALVANASTQDETPNAQPVWSGQDKARAPSSQIKAVHIDAAEIDEYAQLDELEDMNKKSAHRARNPLMFSD